MDHVNFRLTENPFDYIGINGVSGLVFISIFAIIFMSPLFFLGMYVGKKAGYLRSINIYLLSKIWFVTGPSLLQLKS